MLEIRPVSDLRNKFPEIESLVNRGSPIFLTKNGYGAMVVMSLEHYGNLANEVERKLDEADKAAMTVPERHEHTQVFAKVKARLRG